MVESDPLNQLLLALAAGQRYADFVGQSTAAASRNAACDHKNQEILNIFGWIF